MCVPGARAKSQDSSSAAPTARAKPAAKTPAAKKPGTKSGSIAAHKTASSTAPKKSPASTAARAPSGASDGSRSTSAKRRHSASLAASSKSKKKTLRGQQKIDSDRVQAIQEALIREHYLTGEATGTWSQSSEDAMRRYQADHGWQSKTVPDSRALIKLGLGPSHDHLLNPESAMTTQPDMPRATALEPVSHSAAPGAPVSKTPNDTSGPR
jgi:hypothetical protein